MLGILSLLVTGGIVAYESVKFGNFDAQSKADAKRNGETEYFNHKGECRDVNNDHKVFIYYNPSKGYTTRTDLKTGEVRNRTLERQWEDPSVKFVRQDRDNHEDSPCKGVRYIEKSSGKVCVKRNLHYGVWWMTVNGEMLRPDDRYLYAEKNIGRNWDFDRELIANMQKVSGKYLNDYYMRETY